MESAQFSMESISEFLSFFGENKLIQAAVVILLSLTVAKLTDLLITRGIARVTASTRSEVDDKLIQILHRPIFLTVLLIGLLASFLLVEPPDSFRWFGSNFIKTLIVFIWVIFGVRASTVLLAWFTLDSNGIKFVQPATRPLFETGAKLIIIALGIYFVLISWGVDPVGWLATAGIAAVAVGLAAQDTLGNLFAGISILADAPYKIGDYIVLDAKERGKVTRIGLRSTRILTRDDVEVTVPNSVIASSKIVNETSGRWVKQRLRIPVGVAYGSDVDFVKKVLIEVTAEDERICAQPEPWVKFVGFGQSSLDFEIRCWIDDPDLKGRIVDSVNCAVYKTLGKNGIEIPFPKRDLYIKGLPEALLQKLNKDLESS